MKLQKILLFLAIGLLIGCDTKSAEDYLIAAEKLEAEQRYSEAIQLLDKAIEMDDKLIDAYLNRGVNNSFLGNYKIAIEDYNRVLALQPNNTMALFNSANNYKNLKDYKTALTFYNKAFDSKGGDKFYTDLVKNEVADVGYAYDVKGKVIHFERAETFYNLDSLNQSHNDFQACIKQGYKTAESYYWIGYIYADMNNPTLACENFLKAQQNGYKENTAHIKDYCATK